MPNTNSVPNMKPLLDPAQGSAPGSAKSNKYKNYRMNRRRKKKKRLKEQEEAKTSEVSQASPLLTEVQAFQSSSPVGPVRVPRLFGHDDTISDDAAPPIVLPPGYEHTGIGTTRLPKSSTVSNCSGRVRGAFYAHHLESTSLNATQRRDRQRKDRQKKAKQEEQLIKCHYQPEHSFGEDDMKNICLVFDGGKDHSTKPAQPTDLPASKSYRVVRIPHSGLAIADYHLSDPDKGLIFSPPDDFPYELECIAPFILSPRTAGLSITKMNSADQPNKLCHALQATLDAQQSQMKRGATKHVLGDPGVKVEYGCAGVQSKLSAVGVRSFTTNADKIGQANWNVIHDYIAHIEKVMRSIIDTRYLRFIQSAINLLDFKTFPRFGEESNHFIYNIGSLAVGVNVCLESHVDCDFALSVLCIHKLGPAYQPDDEVVAYFCFPKLGVAVPLRPGDVLFFNPNEPHCVSTRCRKSDKLYCVSFYLKRDVVGMNNNKLQLLPKEEKAANLFNNIYS